MKKPNTKFAIILFLFCARISFAQDFKDCATANNLCGESPFFIETTIGIGNLDSGVSTSCLQNESNSVWIKWKIEEGGLLTFLMEPSNEFQDLDFLVFKLISENDCDKKELVRCMASGENAGAPLSEWQICTGPTGLMEGEEDTIEDAGCSSTDNNFLAPLVTSKGEVYVMLVNDFSSTKLGFELSFGGSAKLNCISQPNTTGVASFESTEIELFPSITRGYISLNLRNEFYLGSKLQIYNTLGNSVFEIEKLMLLESYIDLSTLNQGMYVVSIRKGNKVITKKLFIHK